MVSETVNSAGCWVSPAGFARLGSLSIASLLFRGSNAANAFEGGAQSMPHERGAFHSRRVIAQLGENLQLAKLRLTSVRRAAPGHQIVETVKQRSSYLRRLALHRFGHNGTRGRGNSAAASLKTHVADPAVFNLHVNRHFVPAKRIVSLGGMAGIRHFVKVARPLAVIDHHFLVKIAQVGHQANISFTFRIPAASASISSRVL